MAELRSWVAMLLRNKGEIICDWKFRGNADLEIPLNFLRDTYVMAESVEDLVAELRELTPEQLDRVARMVRGFASDAGGTALAKPATVSPSMVDRAVQNGWPLHYLFTEVIGQIGDDFEESLCSLLTIPRQVL